MNTATGALSALRRLGIVIAIAITFLFGLATTVYLSLRSPEVKVPDVVGKDRFEAEHILGDAGLNYRVRATRPSNQLKADTVLFQVPRAGEVVKSGQTVAMDISRVAKEGEASEAVTPEKQEENNNAANANESPSANENKPKRKPVNKNANDNLNANANRNLNINRAVNRNANSGNSNIGTNTNRPALIINNNANRATNVNSRPPVPRPSPTAKPRP
ncbi:MAG TPA: PASTA domain-containing protein [Pyrinomonadaceae bacterium]|nr:PASTA domain-containing protein [Pyrinomonadaceae bacterium]